MDNVYNAVLDASVCSSFGMISFDYSLVKIVLVSAVFCGSFI